MNEHEPAPLADLPPVVVPLESSAEVPPTGRSPTGDALTGVPPTDVSPTGGAPTVDSLAEAAQVGFPQAGFAAALYRPPPPRTWLALAIGVLALPLGLLVSGLAAVGLVLAHHGRAAIVERTEFVKRAEQLSTTPSGLAVLVIPGQLVFLSLSLGAAALSTEHWRQRLRLVRGRMPLWTWPILALATPAVAFVTSLLLGTMVSEPSEHMRQLEETMRSFDGRRLPLLFLMIAGLPGIAEELLYRGYVQSRLLRAWPAGLSIALSALLFGVAHLDPFHALAVLPLGLWLGVVAWRADSLGPAILGHIVNNALALVMARWVDRATDPPQIPPLLSVLILAALASLLASLVLLVRGSLERDPPLAAPPSLP